MHFPKETSSPLVDPKADRMEREIAKVAGLRLDVLLHGETGTGKDTLAKKIHTLSKRSGPFIAINCSAIPETLIESELFGSEKGAFTGAIKSREGYIEASDGGTLYLDEIDSMPLAAQAKLLRVIQERSIARLGAHQQKKLDIRLIASTKLDLGKLSSEGLFRKDFFYRLNVVEIKLPPLREQSDLIAEKFWAYCVEFAEEFSLPIPVREKGLEQSLLLHDWPGNFRELRAAACRHVIGFPVFNHQCEKENKEVVHAVSLKQTLAVYEKRILLQALEQHRSLREASFALGVSPSTFFSRLKKHGLAGRMKLPTAENEQTPVGKGSGEMLRVA